MAMMVGDSQRKRLPPQVSTSMNTTADAIKQHAAEPVDLATAMIDRDLAHLRHSIASAPSASGTLIQKIIDQCRCSAKTPPSTGPPMPAATHTPLK